MADEVPVSPVRKRPRDDGYEKLQKVQQIQEQLFTLMEEEAAEVLRVTKAFRVRKEELLGQRADAIKSCDIPDFWYRVLLQHEESRNFIAECDAEALSSLTSVTVQDLIVPSQEEGGPDESAAEAAGEAGAGAGIQVTFDFGENEYFTDKQLYRKYKEDGWCSSSPVHWKNTPQAEALKKRLLHNMPDPPTEQPSFFSIFGTGPGVGASTADIDDLALLEALRLDICLDPWTLYLESASQDQESSEQSEDEEEEEDDNDEQDDE